MRVCHECLVEAVLHRAPGYLFVCPRVVVLYQFKNVSEISDCIIVYSMIKDIMSLKLLNAMSWNFLFVDKILHSFLVQYSTVYFMSK